MRKHFLLALMATLLPFVSWAADEYTVTVGNNNTVVYNGTSTQTDATVKVMKGATELGDEDYLVKFNLDGKELKDVGEYSVTVRFLKDMDAQDITQTFKVVPRTVKVSIPKYAKVQYGKINNGMVGISDIYFDDNDNIVVKSAKGEGDTDDAVLDCMALSIGTGVEETETGDYSAGGKYVVTFMSLENKNYSCEFLNDNDVQDAIAFLSIEQATLQIDEKAENVSKKLTSVYGTNVDLQTLASELTAAIGTFTDDPQLTVALKDNKQTLRNVGEYTLTVTATNKNYKFEKEVELTYKITRAQLEITVLGNNLTKTYGDPDPDLSSIYKIEGYKYDDADNTEVKITMARVVGEDVAFYLVNPTVMVEGKMEIIWRDDANGGKGYSEPKYLPNYSIKYDDRDSKQFEITKRPVNINVVVKKDGDNKDLAQTEVYGTSPTIDANTIYTYNVTNIADRDSEGFDLEDFFEDDKTPTVDWVYEEGQSILPTSGAKFVQAGTYKATISNKNTDESADNIVISKDYSKNYEIGTYGNDLSYTVTRLPISAKVDNLTVQYGAEDVDKTVENYLAISVFSSADHWGKNETGYNVFLDGMGERYDDKDEVSEKLEALQIFKNEAVIEVAEAVEKVGEYDLVIKATATEAAAIAEGAEPEYPTVKSTNYLISLVPGKLIVKGEENLILDGDANAEEGELTIAEKLKVYNGATVKQVTVKNIKNIVGVSYASEEAQNYTMVGNSWYTLVLPFDAKVRDISKAFGYAVVNVLDDTNKDTKIIKFRLEMGEIKANTPMVIKLDEDFVWSGEGKDNTVTFGDSEADKATIEIKYVEEPQAKDEGNHSLCGTYVDYEMQDNSEFCIWWDGTYRTPSTLDEYYLSKTITPLTAYIKDNNASSTEGIRILLEDIDGTVTVINSVTDRAEASYDAEGWYTINGVKLNSEPTQKGIYINNGKKVIIK